MGVLKKSIILQRIPHRCFKIELLVADIDFSQRKYNLINKSHFFLTDKQGIAKCYCHLYFPRLQSGVRCMTVAKLKRELLLNDLMCIIYDVSQSFVS